MKKNNNSKQINNKATKNSKVNDCGTSKKTKDKNVGFVTDNAESLDRKSVV